MARNTLVIFLSICYIYFGKAESIEELKQRYVEIILECSSEYPITVEDLEELRSKRMSNNESVKCLFACVYRKAGMMNDRGELWIDGVNEISRKYLSDDPVKMNKSVEFTEACETVNDIPVNDGTKGCERAALIFQCTVEKASYFDFV